MKTALVTGANKSIGFETTRQLLKKGYFVYLGSRDLLKGQEAAEKLNKEGFTNIAAIKLDATDQQTIKDAYQLIYDQKGSLDLLINNAGIFGGYPQSPSSVDIETIRTVFETNFFGVIQVTQTFLSLLKQASAASIVNVTSGLASLTLHSDPSWIYYKIKGAAYGPSKTALNAYTVALAYELKDTPIKVNVVDPGYTATDFNQHRGTGSVEDAAAFVVSHAILPPDGPTGKYFSKDYLEEGNESPW
ncbi:MAG: SDR family oxidoreductase [Chitinophagaceae bacterium]|nr:SDR family oxidoreductase [Chitinophagaceae bacterium]